MATQEKSEAKQAPTPKRARAAESANPVVQQLAAVRHTASLGGDKKTAEAANAQLSELGFE